MAEAVMERHRADAAHSADGSEDPCGALPPPVLIESGTRFEGTLTFRGSARIEGEFQGEIAATGRLELAETSRVAGRVEADVIIIAGHFDGELMGRARVEILASAEVTGSLSTARLEAAEGCRVKAKCRTGRSIPPANQSPAPA